MKNPILFVSCVVLTLLVLANYPTSEAASVTTCENGICTTTYDQPAPSETIGTVEAPTDDIPSGAIVSATPWRVVRPDLTRATTQMRVTYPVMAARCSVSRVAYASPVIRYAAMPAVTTYARTTVATCPDCGLPRASGVFATPVRTTVSAGVNRRVSRRVARRAWLWGW